jgi:hypothetical protein
MGASHNSVCMGDAVMRKFIKAFEAGAAFDPDTVHILIGAFEMLGPHF